MSVVTNVVMALAITTTRTVPVPCPDGVEGCCVLHEKIITDTRYEPVKAKEASDDGCSVGVSLDINHVIRSMNFAYFERTPPRFVPVKVYVEKATGYPYSHSKHVVGFLMTDAVEREADILKAEVEKAWKEGGK